MADYPKSEPPSQQPEITPEPELAPAPSYRTQAFAAYRAWLIEVSTNEQAPQEILNAMRLGRQLEDLAHFDLGIAAAGLANLYIELNDAELQCPADAVAVGAQLPQFMATMIEIMQRAPRACDHDH